MAYSWTSLDIDFERFYSGQAPQALIYVLDWMVAWLL